MDGAGLSTVVEQLGRRLTAATPRRLTMIDVIMSVWLTG
jgi:hypothetical protein